MYATYARRSVRNPVLLMRRGMTRLDMARCRMSHDGSRHDVEAQRATTRRRSAEREQRGRRGAACRARSVASRTAARRRVSRRDRLRLGGARAAERAEECAQPVAFPEARAALHASVQRGQHLRQLDPPLLLGREAGGDGHGEGDDAVLARDGRVRLRLDRVDEGDRLRLRGVSWTCRGRVVDASPTGPCSPGARGEGDARLVGCDVARHEEVVRQVGHPHKVAREDASRVGVPGGQAAGDASRTRPRETRARTRAGCARLTCCRSSPSPPCRAPLRAGRTRTSPGGRRRSWRQ